MPKFNVKTPVKGFSGHVAGVDFANGEGETDDQNAVAYFHRHGYAVAEETQDAGKRPAKSASKADWVAYAVATTDLTTEDAEAMTRDELAELEG